MAKAKAVRAVARLAGGQSARRLRSWCPPLEHINTALRNGGEKLLRRVREMEVSNAYASRAVSAWAGYAVRDGIRPTFQTTDDATIGRLRTAWDEWVGCCDADACDALWGLQELVARETYAGGEAFVLRAEGESDIGLGLRVYQAEQLPLTNAGPSTAPLADNEIIQGIEFDPDGRRVAYHFYEQHPGDLARTKISMRTTRRVDAKNVIHVFPRQNAGQIRGLSRLAAGMIRLHLIDGYDDAELDRQRIAAMFAGFITKPLDDNDDGPMQGVGRDEPGVDAAGDAEADDSAVIIDLAPGLLQVLDPGEEITFSNPPQIQGQYEAFQYRNLLAISAALGVPYHVLTGDVERANYSSARVAQLDFKVEVSRFQNRCMIDQFCRGVRRWFLADAAMADAIQPGDAEHAWTWNLPRWDWVDPEAEAAAAEKELDLGITSRRRVVESRGYSLEEIDAEIAADTFRPQESGASEGASNDG